MRIKLLLLIVYIIGFHLNAQTRFIDHVVTEDVDVNHNTSLLHIFAADIDNDGDMDVISASGNSRSDAKVAWYENLDGYGNFGQQIIILDHAGNDSLAIRYGAVYASDFDGDGDMDILTGTFGTNIVSWFENLDGKGNFSDEIIISTDLKGCFAVITADLDGDGDEEVIYNSAYNNSIFWHENTDGNGTVGSQNTIDNNAERVWDIKAEDIDGDGDKDIIASLHRGNKVVWYENTDGLGSFGSKRPISSIETPYYSVFAADIDGDGDLDVISGSSSSVAWHENTDGKGNFGPQNILAQSMQVYSIIAADLDLDGDMDVLSAHRGSLESVNWYENLDGKGDFSVKKPVSTETSGVGSLFSTDIDGDGIIDILSASVVEEKIKWHENVMVSNKVYGPVLFDTNNDGCDSTDLKAKAPNIKVRADNGIHSITTFTNADGIYELFPGEGEYSIQIMTPPDLFSSNPDKQSFNFVGNTTTEYANFCLEPVKIINDVSMVLFNIGRPPRPGFEVTYQMFFRNKGTSVLNGIIVLQFDYSKMEFISSTDSILSQTNSSLSFEFSHLNPFEGKYIDIVFKVFEPPITIADDILIFTAKITPDEGDDNEVDNEITNTSAVSNSNDPNDITVIEGEEINIEETVKYLHYIIRFQNIGSIEATNIRVENILDPNLDWDSFQIENTSHKNRVEIINGNEVSFIFDNINLADSTSNEPESHGFIAYRIKPKENIRIGEKMINKADIFFDFNAAVETNTVTTEVTNPLSVEQTSLTDFSIFPVPATELLTIHSKTGISQIEIYNSLGQLVFSDKIRNGSKENTINIASLQPGIYFLKIKDENGMYGTKKILKNK